MSSDVQTLAAQIYVNLLHQCCMTGAAPDYTCQANAAFDAAEAFFAAAADRPVPEPVSQARSKF